MCLRCPRRQTISKTTFKLMGGEAKTHLRCVCDAFASCKRILDVFASRLRAANASEMRLRCGKSSKMIFGRNMCRKSVPATCKHILDVFATRLRAANASEMRLRCGKSSQMILQLCILMCVAKHVKNEFRVCGRCQAKPAAAAQGKRGVSAARGRKIILR